MNWENKGPENTDRTIELAVQRSKELGIKHVVVASHTGATAEKLVDSGLHVVCVGHHVGFKEPGLNEFPADTRERLAAKGVDVLITTHLMAGLDRSLRFQFQGIYPAEIIANALRMFSQGIKVCVEVAGMALDAGLIPHGEEVVSIGGSGRGADSAIVIVPAHSNYFFDTKIKEVICKPRNW